MPNSSYSIFDNLIEGVQIIDKNWCYVYVNAAIIQQTRIERGDLLGYTLLQKYPGIERTELFTHLQNCLEERKPKKIVNEFTFPDGRVGFFDLSIQPFEDGVLILSVDVTEQHIIEKALKKSHEQLRLSQQLALLGSFEYYIKQDKIIWSDTTFTIMERDRKLGEPTFADLRTLVHPDDRNAFDNVIQEAIERGKSYTHEYRVLLSGGVKHIRSIAEVVIDKEGNVECIEGCVQDITKKKNIQIALANREKNYRLLFEGIQESFIVHEVVWDESGEISDLRYTEINPVTEKTLGKTRDEIIGKTRSELVGPLDEETITIIGQVLKGESVRYERYVFSIDKWFDMFIYSPQPGQIATLNLDVTTRKRAEQRLQRSNIELEERVKERTQEIIAALEREKTLNEMKSQFVTIASHEFRTPLTTLLSSAFLIEQFITTGQPDRVHKHVLRIKDSITSMTSILDDFLSLQTLEQGNVKIQYESFQIKLFISAIIENMNNLSRAKRHLNHVHYGPEEVSTDKRLLNNIVTNLLSNAMKYSSKDINIVTEVDSSHLNVTVTDLGISIPEKDQRRIFDMFFRASNVSNIQGTGLGLNLVKRYVDLLGGSLRFSSSVEKGTSFVVTLPLKI